MKSLNNLKLTAKIGLAFGLVLLIFGAAALWSILGIQGIVANAKTVIRGNSLRGEMMAREVDHLNWANQVSRLLTDVNATKLEVQTDPHQCAFGKWYYSDERLAAERDIPKLKELFAAIEAPHNKLHASAVDIGKVFRRADLKQGDFLRDAKGAHLAWTGRIKDSLLDPAATHLANVETDPHKCSFGKWFYSDEAAGWKAQDPEFAAIWAETEKAHGTLHQTAVELDKMLASGQRAQAAAYYKSSTEPAVAETLKQIDRMLGRHSEQVAGLQKANDIYATETKPSLQEIQTLLAQVRQTVQENVMTDEQMLLAAQHTRLVVGILTAIAVFCGLGLAWVITRGIVGPIKRLVARLEGVAKGDLTGRVEVTSEDEFGQLNRCFNATLAQLHDTVFEFAEGARDVAAAATEIAHSSEEMAHGIEAQKGQTTEITAAVEEMSASVGEVARQSMNATDTAKDAGAKSQEGSIVVRKTIEGINAIAEVVNLSARTIGDLGNQSEQIGKVVSMINDIADQTNLLALNAAIEAARAGQHGRGFAVVADEVRKLAERTTEATREVATSVQAIQKGAGDAVERMGQGTAIVQQGVGLAQQAGGALDVILRSSNEVASLIQSIAAATEQQSVAADSITRNISAISEVTSQTAEGASQAAAVALQLSRKAEQLQDRIAQFTLNDRRIGEIG